MSESPPFLPIIILGAGGHGKVVMETCLAAGRQVQGFLDPGFPPGHLVLGRPILGGNERMEEPEFTRQHHFILGVGELSLRCELMEWLKQTNAMVATIVHPMATLSPSAVIGAGSVIMAGVVVNAEACIGPHAILNTACSVEHDCVMGEDCHIAPGARLAGQVHLGSRVLVGSGAIILPGISVGDDAVVGAGAVVTHPVHPGSTVVGVPAHPLKGILSELFTE